jgi:hypothetical protein
MIRDRGRIKWTAMMLPEHVKMLRDWVKEDTYEEKKEMDEQQLERMNELLSEAMECDQLVTITHYHNQKYEMVIGKLHVVDRFEEVHHISIEDIADARITE